MVASVCRGYGVRPKSALTAVALYVQHRPALEYDFRARFGFGVERIDREELSWQETVALIDGLMQDHTSHTFASAAGWSYVPSPSEVHFYDELDVKLSMNRGKNQPMPQRTKRPWETPKRREVIPAHRGDTEARRERLRERLGLRSVVHADDQPDGQPQAERDDRHQQVKPM